MGLDMYLNGKKYLFTDWDDESKTQKEDGFRVCQKTLEIGYWRKHQDLHDYIVQEFADGVDDCEEVRLNRDDLLKIVADIKSNKIPNEDASHNGGEIFSNAIKWLENENKNESRSVVYEASW